MKKKKKKANYAVVGQGFGSLGLVAVAVAVMDLVGAHRVADWPWMQAKGRCIAA